MVSSRPERTSSNSLAPLRYFSLKFGVSCQLTLLDLLNRSNSLTISWLRDLLAPPLHTAKANMAKIFYPFEIRDCHAPPALAYISGIITTPRSRKIASAPGRHWPIGRLDDQTRLHPIGVVTVDNPLQGRWDQNITICLQNAGPVRGIAAAPQIPSPRHVRRPKP